MSSSRTVPAASIERPLPALPSRADAWSRSLARLVHRLRVGRLTLVQPGGGSLTVTGPEWPELEATLVLHRGRAARRLLLGGDVGFAEAYMDGDWNSPDLAALLELAALNETRFGDAIRELSPLTAWSRLRHLLRPNSRRGSRRNIAAHYDLGNDFYAQWLDPSMTYSSGLFEKPAMSLEEAQEAKYRRLAESLDLRPGQRVLEIGCGWGGFATLAARDFGCRMTALTLSREQQDFARKRVFEAGLADRVEVRLQDYRDVPGRFERIASIEMFEAVGEAYWPRFFARLADLLAPGGQAALQVITIAEERFAAYRRGADFIQRHIFPGGMLPPPSRLVGGLEAAGLAVEAPFFFGDSYARTLADWQRRFQAAWAKIEPLGFDPRFKRMWEYYLAYCEGGFRAGAVNVCHVIARRP